MEYCKECANQKICNENHWCITMDRGRKYNNEWLCDNFNKAEEDIKE